MTNKKLTIEELRELITAGKANDPLVFLECVMNGQDPRKHSKVFELMHDIRDLNYDGLPSPEDWQELCTTIDQHYRYHIVSVAESSNAAKTLAEYLYPKLKNVQIGESNLNAGNAGVLTEQEIELFKEKFNEEF